MMTTITQTGGLLGWLRRGFHRITDALYDKSFEVSSRFTGFLFRISLTLLMAGHRFRESRGFGRATELAYRTLFALVPITALGVIIVATISTSSDNLNKILFQYLLPNSSLVISEYINDFANRASTISIISLLIFILTAVSLLMSIEDAINDIWAVRSTRRFLVKLSAYWSLLTAGPLLLFGSFYFTTELLQEIVLSRVIETGGLVQLLSHIISVIFIWATFFLIYYWLPDTRVSPIAATLGAFIAGSFWELAKFGFDVYVNQAVTLNSVYGPLSILPLFLLWLYFSWVVILWGSQISFVWQNMSLLKSRGNHPAPTGWELIDLALSIMIALTRQFQQTPGNLSIKQIATDLDTNPVYVREVLEMLHHKNFVVEVNDHEKSYMLARAPDHIQIFALISVFDNVFNVTRKGVSASLTSETARIETLIHESTSQTLRGYTLAQMVEESKPTPENIAVNEHPVIRN